MKYGITHPGRVHMVGSLINAAVFSVHAQQGGGAGAGAGKGNGNGNNLHVKQLRNKQGRTNRWKITRSAPGLFVMAVRDKLWTGDKPGQMFAVRTAVRSGDTCADLPSSHVYWIIWLAFP